MIDNVWLPAAIRFGIPVSEFWNLNPKYMMMHQDNYIREKEEELKMIDVSAYYNGMYIQSAIACNFSKKVKYPKKPLSFKNEEKKRIEQMSDEEYYNTMRGLIGGMNKKIKG